MIDRKPPVPLWVLRLIGATGCVVAAVAVIWLIHLAWRALS